MKTFLLLTAVAILVVSVPAKLLSEDSLSAQIAAEIQKIRAAGEPATVGDLLPPSIPDGDNGALIYSQAFRLLDELRHNHPVEWKYMPYESTVKWGDVPQKERDAVRRLLLNDPDLARFYALLEKACGMECQFVGRENYGDLANTVRPHLSQMRECARMLAARATLLSAAGNADGALQDCLTSLKMSDSLSASPIIITGLVEIAMDQIAFARMEEVMRKGSASHGTCLMLLAAVDKKLRDQRMCRNLLGERVFGMVQFSQTEEKIRDSIRTDTQLARAVAQNSTDADKEKMIQAFLKDPTAFMEEERVPYLKTMAAAIAFSRQPYLKAKESIGHLEKEVSGLPDARAALLKPLVSTLPRIFTQEARCDALSGDAEIALACHLYRMKNGVFPSSLAELSPEFLPKLPLDPFTGKDYVYNRTEKGFKVYSLGENMKGDGGQWGKPSKFDGDYDIVWEE